MHPRVKRHLLTRKSGQTMATFHFDLVSPEKIAFSGEVDQVDVPGVEGDFGVLAGHAPVVAAIRPGIITVIVGGTGEDHRARRARRMSDKGLTVLADVAHSPRTSTGPCSTTRFPRMEAKLAETGGRRARPRDRAARSFQEHPAPVNATAMH